MVRECDTTPCTTTTGPDFPANGTDTNNGQCVPNSNGVYCPPKTNDPSCRPWQLSNSRDSCFIDSLANEALNIAGATLHVYKLLGVHEQGKLVDSVGFGTAFSNGDLPGFPAKYAFDAFVTQWRSLQKGTNVPAAAYIGYDFGEIKRLDGSARMYGIDANVRKHITAFSIKQSSNANHRVTKLRLERSDDGVKWYGVSIVPIPDNDCLNTILTKGSVPSRYWRFRPVEFNGGATDYWGVSAIQLFPNYEATSINNIEDKIFLENRDRDYADDPITIKGYYDLVDIQSELSKFGIELPSQTLSMRVNFSQCVASLGRPLVVGDIIEIPSEAQYSAQMQKVLKWMEVTDIAWSSEGYTPGWQPTLQTITLQPAMVSQETQDLFGDLANQKDPNGLGLITNNDGNDEFFQDYFDASQTATANAKDDVPEKGAEGSSTIRAWEQNEIDNAKAQGIPNLQKIGLNYKGLYVEDAMPPNNAAFTEGVAYPTSPVHGAYHRLTFEGLSKDIPAQLYRYSSDKARWIYLETDRRAQFNPDMPTLQEFLVSPTKRPENKITK